VLDFTIGSIDLEHSVVADLSLDEIPARSKIKWHDGSRLGLGSCSKVCSVEADYVRSADFSWKVTSFVSC